MAYQATRFANGRLPNQTLTEIALLDHPNPPLGCHYPKASNKQSVDESMPLLHPRIRFVVVLFEWLFSSLHRSRIRIRAVTVGDSWARQLLIISRT